MRAPFPHILTSICCVLGDSLSHKREMSLNDVLIYILFLAKDIGLSFMYLLAICTSENCLFNSFAHLLIRLFVLWCLIFGLL
jgi:hypothetical protein